MRSIVFIFAALMSVVTSASAVDSGFYLGLGVADGSLTACQVGGTCNNFTVSAKESVLGHVIAGYDFNRFIGVEGEYSDFGSYKVQNSVAQTVGTMKASSISLAARGGYKFSFGLSIFGKLGLASLDTQYSPDPGWTFVGDRKRKSTGLLMGVGVQYDFNDLLGIRLSTEFTGFDDGVYSGGVGGSSLMGILRF
jgi:opacity protein-like surface antigen